jgi:hypothetical protein
MTIGTKISDSIEKHYKKILAVFFVFYMIYLLASFFPFENGTVDTSCLNSPLLQEYYATHFESSINSARFLMASFRLWGYDPYHLAGYPAELDLSLSNHAAILFNFLFGWIFGPVLSFNLAIFLSLLILPILAFYSAKNYNIRRISPLFFFILSIFSIIEFSKIGDFICAGMYGFVLAVFLSFYTSSLFFKYISTKNSKDLAKLAVFGAISFFVHPFSSIMCLALCGPVFLFHLKEISPKEMYKLALCLAAIIAANLIWLLPLMKFYNLMLSPYPFHQTYLTLIFFRLKTSLFFALIMSLFLLFVYCSLKNKSYRFLGTISSSFAILFAISFFGSQTGLPISLFPERFVIPLVLLSVFAASTMIKDKLENRSLLLVLLIFFLLVILMPKPFDLNCGYQNPAASSILEFIRTNTSENARMHVQESWPTNNPFPYFNSQFSAIIPVNTSRQILAAPYSYPNTEFKFTQFMDEGIFGQNLTDISEERFDEYMELYNIKYFLVFSESAKAFFDKNDGFKKVFSSGKYAIYDYINSDESFCYKCNATVKAGYDRLAVENALSNVTILKYHYIYTLKIKPDDLIIKPVQLLDDPVPFIMVENKNCSSFTIYN